jgi:hypothetical protein
MYPEDSGLLALTLCRISVNSPQKLNLQQQAVRTPSLALSNSWSLSVATIGHSP